ncbi:MAG TPA: type III-B CRISPR module RAMP protein Cmr6 [Polyangiaceae bacterium LLY-WYZ-15_(1-7)]|nr:type III-B CRISPR module RAMP protein Cmr6 [Polyangiaceae bacterium LLY-WYZ-15_(1-7)]HJL00263.1 type III-B CRISPR module RAMP protein Cmr6 [Polyangiaceae bacterium LLY-WYZ-15_(1-7)]HJL08278.1 type III-B CRISPR module RAMP protein Cmr6 [Polyangiaceae bacterium LLY-WYZ-15_(1-7)]HJL26024.1 type III-B CRISPR module RAMP protein Cmr6 [Polyangiaceae bacterium LLY-WYZ-15_(1-7)]HJL27912.1 type III-B CRISPR module RAMP protein Cmr6 [Polyangiaceae bacterium LLY-WYZ-15_(1-7)]
MSGHDNPRRKPLDGIALAEDTNLSTALELLPTATDQKQHGEYAEKVIKKVRIPETYARAIERREAGLRALPHTRLRKLTCTGRFILGLGDASVRETGLRLLRPWGLPYIPGSALKGLAAKAAHARGRAWAAPAEPGQEAGEHHRALFGDVEARGWVTFHDAWWLPEGTKPPLALDVMTPHHKDYYAGTAAPLDSDSPTPITFLSAHGTYLLALTGPHDWVDRAQQLLAEALELDGIGGKTAAGYGRFALEPTPEEQRELEEKRAREEKRRQHEELQARARADLEGIEKRDTGPGARRGVARELLGKRGLLPDEELLAIARNLIARKRKGWKKWLASDKRTDEERWLLQALEAPTPAPPVADASASDATEATTWAVGTAHRVMVKKGKKKKRKKKKPSIVFEGHLEDDPSTPVTARHPNDIPGSDALGSEPTRVRARLSRKGDRWRVEEVVPQ